NRDRQCRRDRRRAWNRCAADRHERLCAEMGIHGDFGNERVAEAYRAMIAAARKHGKFPGMARVYNETIMPRYIEMGARFILSGQDATFIAAGAAQRTGFLRKLSPSS